MPLLRVLTIAAAILSLAGASPAQLIDFERDRLDAGKPPEVDESIDSALHGPRTILSPPIVGATILIFGVYNLSDEPVTVEFEVLTTPHFDSSIFHQTEELPPHGGYQFSHGLDGRHYSAFLRVSGDFERGQVIGTFRGLASQRTCDSTTEECSIVVVAE